MSHDCHEHTDERREHASDRSEHAHTHGPDCECGCNHADGESIIKNALIISKQGTVTFEQSLSADKALAWIVDRIGEMALMLAVDGAVLGHVKALIDCDGMQASLSYTRADDPDITTYDEWVDDCEVHACILSISLLSLANTDAPVEAKLAEILP